MARSDAEGEETGCPLGGQVDEQLGMIGVLHTWGRQLQHHPHVHYIVPGGALSPDGKRWRPARVGGTWLLPGAAVAAAFRTGFRDALQAAAPDLHAQIGDAVWRDGCWVHTQPAGSGQSVVRYLARYVARTAISDERIVAADDHAVTFHYTDTATHQRKECTLSADEFLRRYLQHVLPPGQHRVRYFGWLPPAAQAWRMIVETLLAVVIVVRAKVDTPPPWHLRRPHWQRAFPPADRTTGPPPRLLPMNRAPPSLPCFAGLSPRPGGAMPASPKKHYSGRFHPGRSSQRRHHRRTCPTSMRRIIPSRCSKGVLRSNTKRISDVRRLRRHSIRACSTGVLCRLLRHRTLLGVGPIHRSTSQVSW